ncbi:MAG: hypothetical protein IKN89_09335 [Oscillospiraceae bacterium]|nr:hypothetical protein [Oscillospiraceae bacterium]MBR3556105.1 hypothetical protein [Oscillospiraceae bacterium]
MTNKERYQRAFSTLHASDDHVVEVSAMKHAGKIRFNRLAVACAILVLVLGLSSVSYAADIGGIRRSIQLWIHGDQTDAILEVEGGHYSLIYEDADGNVRQQSGGGVAVEPDGKVRPATEDEILKELNSPEVVYEEDGTVWVYYFNQKIEITDKFDDQGVCYVQLKGGEGVLYMTIKDQNGYSISRHNYPNPRSFN